jgi:DNA-binding transcriptional regulator LsrR (DeoR family)
MVKKKRNSAPPRNPHVVGSKHPLSKLSEEQVLVIRKAYQELGWTQQEIATRYGVARQTISKVVNGKRFKHV